MANSVLRKFASLDLGQLNSYEHDILLKWEFANSLSGSFEHSTGASTSSSLFQFFSA